MRIATLLLPQGGETPQGDGSGATDARTSSPPSVPTFAWISPDGRRYAAPPRGRNLTDWIASGAAFSGPGEDGGMKWETLDGVRFAPVIPRPGAIWCVGLNYEDHRKETGRARAKHPTLFTRFAHCLVGHREGIVRPRVSDLLDYEGELAVVIGTEARHASEADALDFVAGYSCFNDASVRDYQAHGSQFAPGKNFWRTGGFGPWMVTPDEVGDPQDLAIETRVNGEVRQSSHASRMTWGVRELIAYISSFTPLLPGDVIATGTPGGVGVARKPPAYLKPGDVVEVEIERIGALRNEVVAED